MAQPPPDDLADDGDYDGQRRLSCPMVCETANILTPCTDGPVDDYGPPVGGGGGAGAGGGIFGPIMLFRKFLSVSAILAVIVLEAAIAIQSVST